MIAEHGYEIRLALIGDRRVGKSSLASRYISGNFTELYSPSLPDENRKIQRVTLDGKILRLVIMDTEENRFSIQYVSVPLVTSKQMITLTHLFRASPWRSMHGFMILYDITNQESFNHVCTWLQEISRYACENVSRLLVGNKCDLHKHRVVTQHIAETFASSIEIPFLETSAKEGTNVEAAFVQIASAIMRRLHGEPEAVASETQSRETGRPRGSRCFLL